MTCCRQTMMSKFLLAVIVVLCFELKICVSGLGSGWQPQATARKMMRMQSSESFASTMPSQTIAPATDVVPSRGLVDYIGRQTQPAGDWLGRDTLPFVRQSKRELFQTRFNLWRQLPWKKIVGKPILKLKLSGSLVLDAQPASGFPFGGPQDQEPVTSLSELVQLFHFGAHDPRIQGILVEVGSLQCGYAKLQELRSAMKYFRQSGKPIVGYCAAGSEKEYFIAMGCDEFYIPPDGGLDLRGFSGSASFFRGVFDKVGIEPQVQRIGKYKSFGDTFNRTSISDAQREVVSSLLIETSNFWADNVASAFNATREDVAGALWSAKGIKDAYAFRDMGFVSGVKYLDQVEESMKRRLRRREKPSLFYNWFNRNGGNESTTPVDPANTEALNGTSIRGKDFELLDDFLAFPRRTWTPLASTASPVIESSPSTPTKVSMYYSEPMTSEDKKEAAKTAKAERKAAAALAKQKSLEPPLLPAGLYLRKMRKGHRLLVGLPVIETRSGPRIAVINAIGGINTGTSSSGGVGGRSVGSDTLIPLIRAVRANPYIKAVVLRIDSPGGSALASDLMWRELRMLAREKPVVASQVDVAASGGYYLSMACDVIVAEECTITGSIGVVTSKFNLEKLNEKAGLNTETLSIGRYAEILSSSRGFTNEESLYFEEGARRAYTSFITKAAASRNMTIAALDEVAQGRVWTGRQALERNLVDELGGLWTAVRIASKLANFTTSDAKLRIENIKEPRRSGFPLFGGATASSSPASTIFGDLRMVCDDAVFASGLLPPSVAADTVEGIVGMTSAQLLTMLRNALQSSEKLQEAPYGSLLRKGVALLSETLASLFTD